MADPVNQWQDVPNPADAKGGWVDVPHPATSSFSTFLQQVGDFAKEVNPAKVIKDMVVGAGDTVRNLYTDPDTGKVSLSAPGKFIHNTAAQNEQALEQAKAAWAKGNYTSAAAHAFNYLVPYGSALNEQTNEIEKGNYGAGMGKAVAFGAQLAAPGSPAVRSAIAKMKDVTIVPKLANPNPVEAEAVKFGQQNDIPVDAGQATGNTYVKGAKTLADATPLGSVVAQRAKTAQDAAFTRVGGELADQAHPTAVAPAQAGRDVTSSIESTIAAHDAAADRQYSHLREIEADPANKRNVQTGTRKVEAKDPKTGQTIPGKFVDEPVMEDVALPVDLRDVKKMLQPVYQQITRQMPITQQRASTGIKALENIINGPDAAPASQVDMDLGTIKAAARGADMPELRTLSQGLAAQAVKQLHQAVSDAVGRAERTPPGGLQNAQSTPGIPAPPEPAAPATGGAEQSPAVQQPPAGGPRGPQTTITVPGEPTQYPGRYEVRELGDVQPSHNGQTFQANPNYGVKNDRNYSNPANQRKVVEWATPQAFEPGYLISNIPSATDGPPVIDSAGNVLGGNGRSMILQRVYAGNEAGAAAYRQMLAERAPAFGVDPEAIAKMKQPVLVRVLDDSALEGAAKQKAISDFNKSGTASLTPAEQAIADSRRVSPETLDHISSELDRFGHEATLAQVIEGHGGRDIMHMLIADGVVSPQEGAGMMTDTALTKAGKERVSQLMLGRFFKDPEQLDSLPAAARNKIERIAAPLARLEAEGDFSLSPHVQSAIDALETARAHNLSLEDYLQQGGLYTKQQYAPEAIELARQIRDVNPNELTARLRKYSDDAQYAGRYEGPGMFGEFPEPKTAREAFNDAFGTKIPADAAAPAKPAETPQAPAKPAGFDESFKPTPAPKKPTAPPLGAQVGTAAGQEALDALNAGRQATAAKYDAAGVLKSLPRGGEEGRMVFDSATWAKDAGIERLREVARIAPAEMPKIARAYLDQLLDKATSEGGFSKAKTVQTQWQQLGPETKELLFPNPVMRQSLDNFFRLARMSAENVNPSGSTILRMQGASGVWILTHPATGIPVTIAGGVLSHLLHSPRGIAALTDGLKISVRNTAAGALAAQRILRLVEATKQAKDLPMAADAQPRSSDRPELLAAR